MSIKPKTLAWLRQTAKLEGGVTAQVLLHLLERADALEQQPTCANSAQVPPAPEAAPVVTDKEILAMRSWSSHGPTFDSDLVEFGRNCYNLGRQHGAAQPVPSTEFAADTVIVHCPETCWVEVRRAADGKVLYDNFRRGSLVIPVGEPPTPPPAPAGGLVERVCRQLPLRPVEARAVIRVVAEWLDQYGCHGCSLWLREEMDR